MILRTYALQVQLDALLCKQACVQSRLLVYCRLHSAHSTSHIWLSLKLFLSELSHCKVAPTLQQVC